MQTLKIVMNHSDIFLITEPNLALCQLGPVCSVKDLLLSVSSLMSHSVCVVSGGSGTIIYDSYNDFAEEDFTPQLDYKGAYEIRAHTQTHTASTQSQAKVYCVSALVGFLELKFYFKTDQIPNPNLRKG